MNKKIKLYFYLLHTLIMSPLKRVISANQIKISCLSLISPRSEITKSGKGKVKCGKKTVVNPNTYINASGGEILIGNNVFINRNCIIVSQNKIFIGRRTSIGPNVTMYDHDHTYGQKKSSDYVSSPIKIGENVWIGAGVIILRGVTVGDNSIVGAGAIITKDIPENTIVTMKKELNFRNIK